VVERPAMAGAIDPNQKGHGCRKYRSEVPVKGMNRPVQGGPSKYLIFKKNKSDNPASSCDTKSIARQLQVYNSHRHG
jgi:hypothetical protein